MFEPIEQALFGYSQGHRLIASSTELDRESSRVLRSVTDMRFGNRSSSLLTVLPLPRMMCHAFIKTWPASAAMRPGSVWSHVLLVPYAVLDGLESVRAIQSFFVQPTAEMEEQAVLLEIYRAKIQPELAGRAVASSDVQVDQRELEKLITAAYGQSEPVEVVVQVAEFFDDAVLGLMDQQWTTLRREFSARTRFRGSTSTVAEFDITVVERPSGRAARVKPRRQRWVTILTEDLIEPNQSVRNMLRLFGPETPRGREDVPALVSIVAAAESGRVQATIDLVSKRFRAPTQMIALKDALFGSSGPDLVSIGQWPKDDVFRLKALLKVEPRALDYGHMQVAARLAAAPDPAEIASDVQWHEIGASTRRQLIEDLSRSVSSRLVVEIALATPVATDLLSLRPDAWGEPALWVPNDVEIVHRLLSSAGKEERSLTLRRLVERHDLHAAAHVTELDPTLWWGLVGTEPFAKTLTKDLEAARTARRLVEQFGSEQIGPPDSPLTSNTQLRALNAAAPADAQLWRFVASDQWVDVASELTDGPTEQVLGRDELCQLLIVVLAAGHQDRDPNLRERAWRTVFGRLHGLLAQVDPPDGATWSLDILLPAGRRLDWCGRLREGLALAAVTDNWQMETLAGIAAGAPDFASEIEARAALIRERMHQSLLEAIVRFFRPND